MDFKQLLLSSDGRISRQPYWIATLILVGGNILANLIPVVGTIATLASIYFYACNDDGCQSIQYRTLFQRNERFTLAFVNAWNYEKRFAKAYLDRDGDLVLEWDVDLDGGVSVAYVAESIATFQTMLTAFDRFTPREQSPDEGGNAGRSLTPGTPPSGGRSLTPGRPPADPGQSGTGGKGSTGDVPGERRT